MSVRFTIDRLGAQGDGIAETERGPVYIPFTLPGEEVNAARERDRATAIAILKTSPQRIEPACAHFTSCGGCAVQHLEEGAYRAWKRDKVVEALKTRGIDAPVGELVPCLPASRRRVTLTARRTASGMLLGYLKAGSHEIVDIEECPIARPEIVAALPVLKALAGVICATPKPFRLLVTATTTGLDIAASDSGKLSDAARARASGFTIEKGLARLSVDGEIVIEPKKPVVSFGAVEAEIQPGGFLQAVESAEAAMAGLVLEHLGGLKRVADLFSGAGTFSLRLAATSRVHAVESDAVALAVLDRAARFATGLKEVTTERRDLFRRPLTAKDLSVFDGLVFDPPRAGAEAQVREIAKSEVSRVAAVSCNPATLARDLRHLIDGGYRLESVTPVDQFLWSPHVEAVALLEKPRKRR